MATLDKLPIQRRTLTIERDELATRAEGDERVPITLSSDSPVRRWFGEEILAHEADAIDLSYARDGLPFLVNHDTDRQVGLVEDVALRKDGKLAGRVRFGRSALAQEIRQDIEDGIRPNISVGYRIDAMTLVETRGEVEVYKATRWTPMETSTVPVPADITVGVGRDAERAAYPVAVTSPEPSNSVRETNTMSDTAVVTPAPTGVVGESRETEAKLIAGAAKMYRMESHLPEWIGKGLTLDQVRGEIEKAQVAEASKATPPGHLDLSAKEERAYNPMAAICAIAEGTWERKGSLEKSASDAIAEKLGRSSRGFFMPMNIRASVTGNIAGTSSLGGAAVETQLVGFIELLRNRMLVRALGAQVLSGLTGNLAIPRQITANTFSWTGENPSSGNSLTALTLDQVTLSPKTGMASTAYSRQALVQTTPDVGALAINDLAKVVAIGIDLAALSGTGQNSQPTGIRVQSNVNTRAMGTHGGNMDWANVVGYETDVAVDNADFGSMAFVTTPGVRGKMKTTLKSTTAGSQYLWEGSSVNGYRAEVTTQLPTNLTKGTSTTICHAAVFGNWSQLIIGEWGGALDVLVDPYTYASQNMIAVHTFSMVDVAVRQPTAFVITNDILV